MNGHMDKALRSWLLLATLIVVAIFAILWATSTRWVPVRPFDPRPRPPPDILGDIELFYTVETVVSTINATLSVFLIAIYIDLYRKTRSEFTLGLMIFSVILLMHALVSIPPLLHAFGFYEFGLGPFAMLPDLFTFAALITLLYLSLKY
jgi:hypothetical protein